MSSASFADNGKWIKEIIYCWSSKKFFPVRERLNVINVSPLTLAETQTRRYKAVILLAKNNYLNLLEWCQIYGQSSRVSWICFRILILMNNNLLAYQFVHNYYYYCNVPLAIIIDRDLPQGCLEWTNGIWEFCNSSIENSDTVASSYSFIKLILIYFQWGRIFVTEGLIKS